jgi:hypothetical protein
LQRTLTNVTALTVLTVVLVLGGMVRAPALPVLACGAHPPLVQGDDPRAERSLERAWVVMLLDDLSTADEASARTPCWPQGIGPGSNTYMGLLYTSDYANLPGGHWLVFVGPFADQASTEVGAEEAHVRGMPQAQPAWIGERNQPTERPGADAAAAD